MNDFITKKLMNNLSYYKKTEKGWLIINGSIVLVAIMCSSCSKDNKSSYFYDSSKGLNIDSTTDDRQEMDSVETLGNMPAYSTNEYDVDDDYEEQDIEDAHPGTKPNDGMFGFDPLDDLDDSYDVKRYSEDSYPDEF